MTFTLYELAQHPEVVEKMHNEVLAVCGESGDITPDHVNQFRYAPA